MSKDWTAEEIQAASAIMKASGHMGYEEFCEELNRKGFAKIAPGTSTERLEPADGVKDR